MKVAIVHDYLTQRGGAERVVLAMARAFPDATIYTTLYEPEGTFPEFGDLDVRVTPLNRFRMLRSKHRMALPLLPWAMRRIDVGDADVVLASSSGWAHGIETDVPVVVYCYNPARWLHQPDDYRVGLTRTQRLLLAALSPALHRWDSIAQRRAHSYIVTSNLVRDRVRLVYGRDAEILPPPLGLDPGGPQSFLPGIEPGYLLTVSRPRGYKGTQVIIDAMDVLPQERLVIVGGVPVDTVVPSNVTVLEGISDEELRWLYAHTGGLIAMSHEDFGLTPPEANSLGAPSLVLRAGGYLDTTVEGVSGLFVDESSPLAVAAGIIKLRRTLFDPDVLRRHASRYSDANFASRLDELLREAVSSTKPRLAA